MSLNAKIVERAALGKLELGTYSDGLGTGLILSAESTRQCNFTRSMMREAAMPKCL